MLPPLLVQTAGSLAAILGLAGLTWWLKLGGAPLLGDDDRVRELASEVEDGFVPVAITRDSKGRAALARDAAGRIIMIKRHGNRFAGRVLGPAACAVIWRDSGVPDGLEVDCGEARFGKVYLDVDDPEAWAATINALNAAHHA